LAKARPAQWQADLPLLIHDQNRKLRGFNNAFESARN
jgi:hypothetical protein